MTDASFQSQELAEYGVEPDGGEASGRSAAVVFSGSGRTCQRALPYSTGFSASQAFLDIYTARVDGYRLDVDPGPTPTAPVRQALGAGPFLT